MTGYDGLTIDTLRKLLDRRALQERYSRGEISARKVVAELGISHGELYVLMHEEKLCPPRPTKERLDKLDKEVRASCCVSGRHVGADEDRPALPVPGARDPSSAAHHEAR
jgi:hypothetical protein